MFLLARQSSPFQENRLHGPTSDHITYWLNCKVSLLRSIAPHGKEARLLANRLAMGCVPRMCLLGLGPPPAPISLPMHMGCVQVELWQRNCRSGLWCPSPHQCVAAAERICCFLPNIKKGGGLWMQLPSTFVDAEAGASPS